METKSTRRRKPVSYLPEDFKLDPTLVNRYPDALFAEKHTQANENLKKHGLPGKVKDGE
ncbi:MAG: hypothetical protein LH606_14990 [Cytophagaceae bacterium]|nr:hypothetical protein [Cytophagaceae bacterium]